MIIDLEKFWLIWFESSFEPWFDLENLNFIRNFKFRAIIILSFRTLKLQSLMASVVSKRRKYGEPNAVALAWLEKLYN